MELKRRLFNWFTLILLGVGTVGAIISSYQPVLSDRLNAPVADQLVFALFYTGLFGIILGLAILTGYLGRQAKTKLWQAADHQLVVRQGFLLAIGVVALLVLQGLKVLSGWDAALLIIALILVELSFHTKAQP